MLAERNTDPGLTEPLTLDVDTAWRAVDVADMRALLMMVFHHSGDRYWLSERFHPGRDVRLIAPEDAGLPQDVCHEIREAAVAILTDTCDPAVTCLDDALFLEMMRITLGENVPGEYLPMMREQMGLVSPLAGTERLAGANGNGSRMVLVVGAGESGIILGAILNDLGIDYLIVEQATTFGGTWRDNTYPGCAVDTPNHSYSYSFGTRYPWTRYFSERNEIQDYLQGCADEFDVRKCVRFGTRCVKAVWQEDGCYWRVLLEENGRRVWVNTRFLVSAIGPFGDPQTPDIKGLESFRGSVMHSARWRDDVVLDHQSVAIIGTGASCMQIGPAIADRVDRLTIFQRTAQWVRPVPRFHERVGEGVQVLLQREPYYSRWYRFLMMWRYGDGLLATLRKDPNWPHPHRSVNKNNDRHREQMTRHIHEVLGERQDLIAKCVPDYPPYEKRILLDNGWYETLLKPNVTLVTEAIAEVEPTGIRLGGGSCIDTDVLILATGFDVSRNASRLDIRGCGGLGLADKWAGGIGSYLGMAVPGFPNFLMMHGPNTLSAYGGSAMFISETQARYIALMVLEAVKSGIAALDVRPELYEDYINRVDAEHDQLIWTHPGTTPYYRNAFGKVRTLLPWRMVDYFAMTQRPDFNDFDIIMNSVANR